MSQTFFRYAFPALSSECCWTIIVVRFAAVFLGQVLSTRVSVLEPAMKGSYKNTGAGRLAEMFRLHAQ